MVIAVASIVARELCGMQTDAVKAAAESANAANTAWLRLAGRRLEPGHRRRLFGETRSAGGKPGLWREHGLWRIRQRLCDTLGSRTPPRPGWRNWQTQQTQNLPALVVMGVRPPLPAPEC